MAAGTRHGSTGLAVCPMDASPCCCLERGERKPAELPECTSPSGTKVLAADSFRKSPTTCPGDSRARSSAPAAVKHTSGLQAQVRIRRDSARGLPAPQQDDRPHSRARGRAHRLALTHVLTAGARQPLYADPHMGLRAGADARDEERLSATRSCVHSGAWAPAVTVLTRVSTPVLAPAGGAPTAASRPRPRSKRWPTGPVPARGVSHVSRNQTSPPPPFYVEPG